MNPHLPHPPSLRTTARRQTTDYCFRMVLPTTKRPRKPNPVETTHRPPKTLPNKRKPGRPLPTRRQTASPTRPNRRACVIFWAASCWKPQTSLNRCPKAWAKPNWKCADHQKNLEKTSPGTPSPIRTLRSNTSRKLRSNCKKL